MRLKVIYVSLIFIAILLAQGCVSYATYRVAGDGKPIREYIRDHRTIAIGAAVADVGLIVGGREIYNRSRSGRNETAAQASTQTRTSDSQAVSVQNITGDVFVMIDNSREVPQFEMPDFDPDPVFD